jgi:hypothetical protein
MWYFITPAAGFYVTFCSRCRFSHRDRSPSKSHQKRRRQSIYSMIGEAAMWIRGTKYTVNHRSNKNSSVLRNFSIRTIESIRKISPAFLRGYPEVQLTGSWNICSSYQLAFRLSYTVSDNVRFVFPLQRRPVLLRAPFNSGIPIRFPFRGAGGFLRHWAAVSCYREGYLA